MKTSRTFLSGYMRWFKRWMADLLEQRWFNVGLRTKMSALVTVGVMGLLAIFSFIVYSTTQQATQQLMRERVMMARMSATAFDSTLHHVQNTLSMLAVQLESENLDLNKFQNDPALIHESLFDQGVYLFDHSGRLADTSRAYREVDWQNVDAVKNALSKGTFSLSIIDDELPLIVAAVPIMSEEKVPVGGLAAIFDLSGSDFSYHQQPFILGKTGAMEIIDAEGRALLTTNPDRGLKSTDRTQIINQLFIQGKPGIENCLGCYGNDSAESWDEIIAFAPLSNAPWGVLIRQQAQEVFAPVRRIMIQILIFGLATFVGAMGLVWLTTNSVIEPVQALTAAAERIASGNLSRTIEKGAGYRFRRDEIGQLAASFDTMRVRLRELIGEIRSLNSELDARVQERTHAALKAQMEAQMARDDLRAVIDALGDGLLVVGVDDHRVLQSNIVARSQWCQTGSVGEKCYNLYHADQPCSAPHRECTIPKVLESGQTVKVTHSVTCPETKTELAYEIVASPMTDSTGRITRIVELWRDVTEDKMIKESLVRRNQQLSILNAIASTVNQSLNLEDILGKTLEEVLRLTGIDVGAVFLQEEGNGDLRLMAYRGISEDAARLAAQLGMLDSSCGGIVEKGRTIIVPDIARYRGRRARSMQSENINLLVHVPLTAKGYTLGSMCVGLRQQREIDAEEEELLKAIGSQIAVAVENARLYTEVQHKEQVRGELFRKAISAQEEERKRIARDLHDDTSQALTALLFSIEEGIDMDRLDEIRARLEGMQDLTKRTLDGVHKLIFDLRPSLLDHLGLVPAIRWFASSRLEPRGVRLIIQESATFRLPPEVETALYRIVQEAVSNITRHAAARNVSIQFEFEENHIKVIIEDDGVGFDLPDISLSSETAKGYGLLGMQERLELLGGDLFVDTTPGAGTKIVIEVPLSGRRLEYV